MRQQRIAHLRRLLAEDPNDSFSRYALALEHAGMGEAHEAVKILEELLTRDPSYVACYQQLGLFYSQADRVSDAIAILRRGIEVARTQNEHHALSEMRDALDDLTA
jgi:tetratricopeptide (TPR) repeat protein